MTESLQERNTRYLGYLASIGVLEDEHYEALTQKCGDIQDKKLLFEISNVFANFTASDWFDLSCRMFNNWEKTPQTAESARASNQPQRQRVEPPREEENNQEEGEEEENDESQNIRVYSSRSRSEKGQTAQSDRKQQSGNQAFDRSALVRKVNRFCNIAEKYVYKSYFLNLKDHFDHFRQVVFNDTYETEEADRVLAQRNHGHMRHSDRSNRNLGERDWHNKLYFDHFQKQAQLEIKREIKRAGELDDCTFVPQINPVDPENPVLTNVLRVPVYERLLQAKPTPANAILDKHEYRELKGATFQPDISKSQNRKWQTDYKGTPEDRMRSATERLYGDAQIKEKIMCLRQMNQKQQESEAYTFSPQLYSPKKNKENYAKTDLTKSVDRLYDENMKRQRKLLRKEVEVREQELEECTFQPERPARGYKPKNESELDELNAHERLYERFRQKRERSNYFAQDKELSRVQDSSLRQRSNSVMEGKTPKKSPKEFNSINSAEGVNTPAFDRLYKDMSKRKQKLTHLKDKVQKEEGATFQPKTNWSRKSSRSISAANRSQQDIRYSSRYNEAAYIQ